MQKTYDIVVNTKEDKYAGSIIGYVTDEHHILENFLEKNDYYDFEANKYKYRTIGIIESLYVEEEYRNQGYGTELMDDIMYKFIEYHHVDHIFLVCDGIQSNDINLQKWYEDWGFEVVSNKFSCPLMINNI